MINIAIDGPSGAGKSTLAKAISKKLNLIYLDTGAMYRAIGLKAVEKGISCIDNEKVAALLPNTDIEIKYINGVQQILLDKVDVSTQIRRHEISRAASDVSAIPAVRLFLVEMQRKIALSANCVLDGRDIGTYVLPNANFKFFITATPEVRAKRRHEELILKGDVISYEKVLHDILERDYNDSNRSFAPLKQASDAIFIDTSCMTIDEVIQTVIEKVGE